MLMILLTMFTIHQIISHNISKIYKIGSRFRAVQCFSDNFTVILHTCHLKAYSRKIVVLNLHMYFQKPLFKPTNVEFIILYRYGTIYREVINTQKRDWCIIMEGESTHLMISLIIDRLRTSAPQMFHKCPYVGEQKFMNVTLDETKKYDVFPQGYYKVKVMVYNSTDAEVFKMVLDLEIKSPLKESFG